MVLWDNISRHFTEDCIRHSQGVRRFSTVEQRLRSVLLPVFIVLTGIMLDVTGLL